MRKGRIFLPNYRIAQVKDCAEMEREDFLKSIVAKEHSDELHKFIHITYVDADYTLFAYTLDVPDVWYMYRALNDLRGNVQEMKDAGALPPHALQDVLDQAERVASVVRDNMKEWG